MAVRVHVDVFGGDAGIQKTITNLLSVGAIDALAKRGATFAQLRPSRPDVRDKSVIVHLVANLLAVVVAASDRHARKIGMRRGKHPEVQQPSLLDETPHGDRRDKPVIDQTKPLAPRRCGEAPDGFLATTLRPDLLLKTMIATIPLLHKTKIKPT